VARIVSAVVERVFAVVSQVRDLMLATHRAARLRGDVLHEADIDALRRPLLALLARDETAVGMGVIVAPGLLPEQSLRLEWWQSAPDMVAPTRLEVDLSADSFDFYDYAAAEWFVVPRQTGERHIVGPYVDVHGTDRYLLTLTEPVLADGIFLGVAGADVPVSRFETLVLRGLADLPVEVVVVSAEGRVVLSTSARWLTGELLPPNASTGATDRVRLPDLPWQMLIYARGGPGG
jgi:hypothetical protein